MIGINLTLPRLSMGSAPVLAPPLTATTGAMFFNGTNAHAQFAASSDFDFGTGDFTIEWWQWRLTEEPLEYRRVFSMGSTGRKIAVSYENGTFFLYNSGGAQVGFAANLTTKAWHHIAVSRQSGTLRIWIDGVSRYSNASASVYGDAVTVFTVGSESTSAPAFGRFSGWLTNFRVVKGTGIYGASMTVPNAPLTAVAGTSLLLNATSEANVVVDSNTVPKTASVVANVGWRASTPFTIQ